MVNNRLDNSLLRGAKVGNLVGYTGRRASRSVTGFDVDLGALIMSPWPYQAQIHLNQN